jgi:hypothetical protein
MTAPVWSCQGITNESGSRLGLRGSALLLTSTRPRGVGARPVSVGVYGSSERPTTVPALSGEVETATIRSSVVGSDVPVYACR